MGVKTFRSIEVLSFVQEYTCNHTALRRCRHHSVPIAALAHLASIEAERFRDADGRGCRGHRVLPGMRAETWRLAVSRGLSRSRADGSAAEAHAVDWVRRWLPVSRQTIVMKMSPPQLVRMQRRLLVMAICMNECGHQHEPWEPWRDQVQASASRSTLRQP